MSLFASLGQGDIWALSGISFASPINDLLDSGNFKLEDLLAEDELIQEVKSKNDRLIEFLCTEESITKLIDYVIVPAQDTDSDDRKFKYPYMSCEVVCCEIPELLYNLVEENDGKHLDHLFSFLKIDNEDSNSRCQTTVRPIRELNCYLAGYFEKILEMLFRKMTNKMMFYFNEHGVGLLTLFLQHISNYSIMQIIQRLMLPHLPFNNPQDVDTGFEIDSELHLGYDDHCHWSFLPQTCVLLLEYMLETSHPDVPLHISDMLITILQLSPPETLLIKYLCEQESIERLLVNATMLIPSSREEFVSACRSQTIPTNAFTADGVSNAATVQYPKNLREKFLQYVCHVAHVGHLDGIWKDFLTISEESLDNFVNDSDEAIQGKFFTSMIDDFLIVLGNTQLAATSVLESLISRLFEAGFPMQLNAGNEPDAGLNTGMNQEEQEELYYMIHETLHQICTMIIPLVHRMTKVLQEIIRRTEQGSPPYESTEIGITKNTLLLPSKIRSPRLGYHGLQMVKLIEAFVRIGNASLDESFCKNLIFKLSLQLFCIFEYHSVLHLSIQRIFVTIFESNAVRSDTQAHICGECELLPLIMRRIISPLNSPPKDCNPNKVWKYMEVKDGALAGFSFHPRHSSIMGNLILIAHSAFMMLDTSEDLVVNNQLESAANMNKDSGNSADDGGNLANRSTSSLDNTVGNNSANTEVEHREKALLIREKIKDVDLLETWDEFCHTALREVLDHQTMGSYEMPPVEIAAGSSPGSHIASHTNGSEEGMLKLGVDLEAFLEEDEHVVDVSHSGNLHNDQLFTMTFREGDFLHHRYDHHTADEDGPGYHWDTSNHYENHNNPVEDFADFSVFGNSPGNSGSPDAVLNSSDLSDHLETIENVDFGDPTFDDF